MMTMFLMLGKSSEITMLLDRHSKRHEYSYGYLSCEYFKSRGFLQKGNYTGTIRKVDEILMGIESIGLDAPSLSLPSMLLWVTELHTSTIDLGDHWRRVAKLWHELISDESTELSPSDLLCASMAFAGALYSSTTKQQIVGDTLPDRPLKGADDSSLFERLQKQLEWKQTPTQTETKKTASSKVPQLLSDGEMRIAADGFYEYISRIAATEIQEPEYIQKRLLLQRLPEAPTCYSERVWMIRSTVAPLSIALREFMAGDYDASYERLFSTRHIWNRVGGSILTREILEQTFLECLLRRGSLIEARAFLSERTTLVPNDSQSWRRLASVFGRLGQEDEARRANYTAWQLGIGQGGFGGPK
jgi:hypothetical protein